MQPNTPTPNGIAATKTFRNNDLARRLTAYSLFAGIVLWCAAAGAQPVVNSVSPLVGYEASTATITGTGFNATPANNIVHFGGALATVVTGSATSLTVAVPRGTSYMPVSVTDISTSLTGQSPLAFLQNFPSADTGTIDFAGRTDFATGTHPSGIAIGDIDGDGKPDIIIANTGANTISVYRNLSAAPGGSISAATFAAPVIDTVPFLCFYLALADIDGDGKLDIATAAQTDNRLVAIQNTSVPGTVSFGAQTTVAISTSGLPYALALADIDGNGQPDLLCVDFVNEQLAAFRNKSTPGTISFSALMTFGTAANPVHLAVQDFDGDGKPDVAVACQSANVFQIFRNTSVLDTFDITTFAPRMDFFTSGQAPQYIMAGDIDGDGKADVIIGNRTAPFGIQVFRNTSVPGTITLTGESAVAAHQIQGMSIGDFDGDGKPDIVVTNSMDTSVAIYRNNSTVGTPSFEPQARFATLYGPVFPVVGDIDGDGKADIAVTNYMVNNFSILRDRNAPVAISNLQQVTDNAAIFPNPVSNWLTITTSKETYHTYTIINSIGQQILQGAVARGQTKVNVRTLPAGSYYVVLNGEKGDIAQKFEKL